MIARWFFSKTVRQLSEVRRLMGRTLNEQRDLLSPEAVQAIEKARGEALEAIRRGANKKELLAEIQKLDETARKYFKPYTFPAVRENVKEFLVAIVTILSFTTFFLQLTKIPTGSMQPTLFGIVQENLKGSNFQIPPFYERFVLYWTQGISYKHLVAPFDGEVVAILPPKLVFPFVKTQTIVFANENQQRYMRVWFPPDEGVQRFGDIMDSRSYKKGEDILKLKVVAGDHLLVDRFTYNFRHPKRGEIIVFKTRGILGIPNQEQLYIKRLVALPEERVQISNDQHIIINGDKLTASTRRFEMVYSMEDGYRGHINDLVGAQKFKHGGLAPLFPNEDAVQHVPEKHYMAMGDNTLNSADSRAWGFVPQENVIGKCWFVYWPFTERFGWGYR